MSLVHWLIVLIVVLLMFGTGRGRIQGFMGDLAEGIKAFKKGMKDEDHTPKKVEEVKAYDIRPDETKVKDTHEV